MKEKKYFSDYAPIPSEADKLNPKKFKYIGKYKAFDFDDKGFNKFKLLSIVFTLLIVFTFGISGMVDSYAGRCAYVLIPYVLTVFPILYLIMGVIKLVRCTNKFTRKQYDFSIIRIYHSVLAILVIDCFVCIADVIMCLTNYSVTNKNDIIFFSSQAAMLVIVVFFYLLYKRNIKHAKDLS